MKQFSKYMFLKMEILLIPLLANRHIFEVTEDDHPRTMKHSHAAAIIDELGFANDFLSPGVNSRAELVPSLSSNIK
jgi:hypothetical protein